MQDGHVLLVVVEPFQPIGQFMLGQVDFKGFFFLVLFQLLGGKGGKAELGGQVSVGLTNENESVKAGTWIFRRGGQEVVE